MKAVGDVLGPLFFGMVFVGGWLALIALFVANRRANQRALAALESAARSLGIGPGHGTMPAHGQPTWRAIVGELRGRPIAIELVARRKGTPPVTYVSRRVANARTVPLPSALYHYNLPWLCLSPKPGAAGGGESKGLTTGDAAFDAAYLVNAIVGMNMWTGATTLQGHFALSPAIAPALARVPLDVSFSFDGEFVLATWREWHLEESRLAAVIEALDVMGTDVPSWIDQLARAGAAIR